VSPSGGGVAFGAVNVVLWIIAGLLAPAFLAAGLGKLTQPKEKLAESPYMKWTEDFSAGQVKTIGALEVAAAAGLILPPVLGIAQWLAPLAALGLVLLMSGAAVTHWRRGEKQVLPINAVLAILAAIVVWGRFGPYPF
jgi:uncharacterized membrane protein YphA (DoxX/SURF4 family)